MHIDLEVDAPTITLEILLMKITKNKYLAGFSTVIVILALVRCAFPDIAKDRISVSLGLDDSLTLSMDSTHEITANKTDETNTLLNKCEMSFFNADGSIRKNRILSVPKYSTAFPDSNNVQLDAAERFGVSPVENRKDAESRKRELVYISSNPYYHVDRLHRSIPYLVPRAAILLNDIGRTYYDSLQIKGVPLHQIIVTSVLRTREDIKKLQNYNHNATENSCHLYGTTFDICYNRYKTVQDPDGTEHRKVRNDTLKWVLSEVLRDMRQNNRCYVKYEVKQGCFHITVR